MRNLDGTLYNWVEGESKENFEKMLTRLDIQEFVYDEAVVYLIDRQKHEITKISNRQIIDFFYHNVYMTQIDITYINMFLELGGFKLKEWY